jgi:hypothetical protein
VINPQGIFAIEHHSAMNSIASALASADAAHSQGQTPCCRRHGTSAARYQETGKVTRTEDKELRLGLIYCSGSFADFNSAAHATTCGKMRQNDMTSEACG